MQDLTHGNAQQANAKLNTCYGIEDFQYASLNKPVVGSPCQAETEDIFKDKEARESFDGDISYVAVSIIIKI